MDTSTLLKQAYLNTQSIRQRYKNLTLTPLLRAYLNTSAARQRHACLVLSYCPLIEMRLLKIINGEEIGGGNLMGKNSLVPAVQDLWNTWEIHCLILTSLFLQVFLFVFAGLRRRSASPILHTVLWLAYLSADSVAIFVLGHLAVHASEPGRQLISFWAPFVLVHLGGQDSITALSRQDNELWKRHLLGLVSQVVVAGYVVAKASWPDGRLKAAMVLMFFSGCSKYAERTLCLYLASPTKLRSGALARQSETLRDIIQDEDVGLILIETLELDGISRGSSSGLLYLTKYTMRDILSVDAPLNHAKYGVSFAKDRLPDILKRFKSSSGRCKLYEHVGALLTDFYQDLYTKNPIRKFFLNVYLHLIRGLYLIIGLCECDKICECLSLFCTAAIYFSAISSLVLFRVFQYVSALIALVLFWAVEKGGKDTQYPARADIIVSYILLLGAIVLDVSSTTISIFFKYRHKLPAIWRSKKQWSEELAQYNMMKRHADVQDTTGTMASIHQWIGRRLGAWGVELLDVTYTPMTEDHTPIKEFILDNLLGLGTRKKWDIASTRGRHALEEWMDKHRGPDSRKALVETTIGSGADFPTSVLIWHVATNICYYFKDNEDAASTNNDSDDMNKKPKQMSRELSNYIMYLVFKSGVMLTTNSQLVHDKAHVEITTILSSQDQQGQPQVALDEKAAVMKLFQASKKEEQQDHQSVVETVNHQEAANNQEILLERIEAFDSPVRETFLKHIEANSKKQERQQDQSTVDTEKSQEPPSNDDNNAGADIHMQKVVQSAEAGTSPVLPRACLVARELLTINDEAERWGLIVNVWAEMLYYVAPRCGCAFHYEHLSTGGEFITHLLVLMKFLGPFLPPP